MRAEYHCEAVQVHGSCAVQVRSTKTAVTVIADSGAMAKDKVLYLLPKPETGRTWLIQIISIREVDA